MQPLLDYPGPPILSPAFLDRAERIPASSDPDEATAQTVEKMCDSIRKSAQDPIVQRCALEAVRQWRGGPAFAATGRAPLENPGAIAESCWWWAKHQLKFVHHSALILAWLNERDQLQLLIEPSVLVRMRQMRGDCAIYTMLICAFLDCFHVPWEIVTLAVDPSQPTIFGHVFPRVVLPDGRRVALDASHGKYPGWQVPRNHTFRSQAWDQDGEPIPDTPTFEGLHDYVPTPAGMWRSGLGQDDSIPTLPVDTSSTSGYEALYTGLPVTVDNSSSIDLSSYLNSIDPSGSPIVTTPVTYGGVSVPAGSVVVPSQSSANYANAATALAKMGLSLAQINAMQPGMVVNPNGQIIYQNPGYPVSSGASISAAIGSNSILLYGGLALLAVLLIGSLRK